MAIQNPIQTHTFNLQTEIASRVILLTRDVLDNQNGSIATNFGGAIHPKSITYELDEEGNKTSIYESADLGVIEISQSQLMIHHMLLQSFRIMIGLVTGLIGSRQPMTAAFLSGAIL